MESMEAQRPPRYAPATPPQATPTPLLTTSSSRNTIVLVVNLISRILTCIFLFIALIVLATNNGTLVTTDGDFAVHFPDIITYRYVMAAVVIGFVYTLVQLGFVLYQVIAGKRLFSGKPMLHFDFYADKVVSGLLATAAGAGFGISSDDSKSSYPSLGSFFDKGNATASLVLFAFLFNEASQIVSSYALQRTGYVE